jgi:hypothetical protein
MNLSPIQMEWFLNLEGYKTKLNWYLLEFALEYYDFICKSPVLGYYREQYNEEQIAQYCAYYARRLKESMLNYLRGRRKNVIFYSEYAADFYPHHDDELTRTLNRLAREAFDYLNDGCEFCPQRCYIDYESTSPLFDEYKD